MRKRLRIAIAAALCEALAGCRTSDATEPMDAKSFEAIDSAVLENPTDSKPLQFEEYDVRFTNPVCKLYKYGSEQNVVDQEGDKLAAKPKDVFCKAADAAASGDRPESPQSKLLDWINDPATKEIFFAYLSFSNKKVAKALCDAVKERGVKVTFVLDSTTSLSTAESLLACELQGDQGVIKPTMYLRGHQNGADYAHNKIFMVNPGAETMKISFSSGNMTSGLVLHHENWHFVTLKSETYFAQAHLCLMRGMVEAGGSAAQYRQYIRTCRDEISQAEESDIKTFFIPGEGARATTYLNDAIAAARRIRLAAHRFSYNKLIAALKTELDSDQPAELQMVFDDDIWWAGHGDQSGPNVAAEYGHAMALVAKGGAAKWMETNHAEHLLHHNKYLIFEMPDDAQLKSAVFGGAGNLTGTAFKSNFENFYYIEIPSVVAAFQQQYDHVWDGLATRTEDLPAQNILPKGN